MSNSHNNDHYTTDTNHREDFSVSADHRVKVEKAEQIPRPRQRTEKAVKREGQSDTKNSWSTWNCLQEPVKMTK